MAKVDVALVGLLQDIGTHRKRTGEAATLRAFWPGWLPLWVPPLMPAVVVDMAAREARR